MRSAGVRLACLAMLTIIALVGVAPPAAAAAPTVASATLKPNTATAPAFATPATTPATARGASTTAAPAATTTGSAARRVVIVAVPGLRWDDLSVANTPALWALAGRAAVGSLSVRSARSVTCPGDGFATLSAGNRARDPRAKPRSRSCPDVAATLTSANLATWMDRVREDNEHLEFDAEVGALGDAVDPAACTVAGGVGAALAASDRAGHVDVLGGPRPDVSWARCGLVIVSAPSVREPDRAAGAHAADDLVRAVVPFVAPDTTVMVVGVSETGGDPPHLHVVMAAGRGFGRGELESPTTRRAPYVQLIDVAPTVLRALGIEAPQSMAGRPMRMVHGSSVAQTSDAVRRLVDLDVAAQAHRRLVPPFFLVLVVAQLVLYVLAWAALRRLVARRERRRILRVTEVAAVAGAAALPATFLANVVPWWRTDHPVLSLLAAVAVATAVVAGLAFGGPWRRALLGPTTVVTAVTALVLVADLVTGARLQMLSLAGYSPLVAGRFAGVGNVAFAVFATASLLTAAALTSAVSRTAAVAIVGIIGGVAVAVDGAPTWGDDFGGVIALVTGFALLGLSAAGRRVTWRRLAVIAASALVAVAVFALLDYARPPDAQTHLGRFVGQVLHGGASTIIVRKATANLHLLTHSVLTLLVPLAVALLAGVLLQPSGSLRRAFAAAPALRHGLVATLAMGVVGALVNDSGVAIPAVAMTVAIPVAIAVSARVARDTPSVASPSREDLGVGAHGDAPATT